MDMDMGFGGDFGGDFGDFGGDLEGGWGTDYGGDFAGDWGWDYGGNYNGDFGGDWEIDNYDNAPENFPVGWDTDTAAYEAYTNDFLAADFLPENSIYDNEGLPDTSPIIDTETDAASISDNIDLFSDELDNTDSDLNQLGIGGNTVYEEALISESSLPGIGETDIPDVNLEVAFEQPTDLNINDNNAVDAYSTTETILEAENTFDEIPTSSLEIEDEQSLPLFEPSFETEAETFESNVLDLENGISGDVSSEVDVLGQIDLASDTTLPQETSEILAVEMPESAESETLVTNNLDAEEVQIDNPESLAEIGISSQEATSMAAVDEKTNETRIDTQPLGQSEVSIEEEQLNQIEEADQEIQLYDEIEKAEEQSVLQEELNSEQEAELVQLEEIAPVQELSKDVEFALVDLEPNTSYEKNGYTYQTDNLGRPEVISGDLRLETGVRTPQQTEIGRLGEEDDQGGHMIATRFDGPPDAFNIVPQNANLNQGAWKSMENEWADSLKNGSEVNVEVQPIYDGNGIRPEAFGVSYTVDGVRTDKFFENISSKS